MEIEYVPGRKNKARHPDYAKNKNRIRMMLQTSFGVAFRQAHNCRSPQSHITDKSTFINPVDSAALEHRKWTLSITNQNIQSLMENLSGCDSPSMATLSKKFNGAANFSSAEILLISTILDLSDREIIDFFNLRPFRDQIQNDSTTIE